MTHRAQGCHDRSLILARLAIAHQILPGTEILLPGLN